MANIQPSSGETAWRGDAGHWPVRAGLEEWLSTLKVAPDPAKAALVRAMADQIDRSRLGPMRRACLVIADYHESGQVPADLAVVAKRLLVQLDQFAGPLPAALAAAYSSILNDIDATNKAAADDKASDPFAGFATVGDKATA